MQWRSRPFSAADKSLHADAFEDYIQGLVAADPKDGIDHLREAVKIDPDFAAAWLALGRAYFTNQDYDQAAATLGHLPRNDPNALEADFYRGLAFFYTGNYREAQNAFAFVSTRLPLPEVVNNQGVAMSRRGQDGGALFQQAIAADPRDPDYHFNLAVALAHRKDNDAALKELDQVLELRPEDTEAQAFAEQLKNPRSAGPEPRSGPRDRRHAGAAGAHQARLQ